MGQANDDVEDDDVSSDDEDYLDVSENCEECLLWGEWQCREHGEMVIAMQRDMHDGYEAAQAVKTLQRVFPNIDLSEVLRACWERYSDSARALDLPAQAATVLDPFSER